MKWNLEKLNVDINACMLGYLKSAALQLATYLEVDAFTRKFKKQFEIFKLNLQIIFTEITDELT